MSKGSTKVSSKLKVKFAGIEFISPIGVAPMGVPLGKGGTPEHHAEVLLKHVEAGAGYISLPGTLFQTEETIAKLHERAVTENLQTKINSSRFFKSETPEKSAEGIVFMTFHFKEAAANILTVSALDPVAKIPEYKVCAVNVQRVYI